MDKPESISVGALPEAWRTRRVSIVMSLGHESGTSLTLERCADELAEAMQAQRKIDFANHHHALLCVYCNPDNLVLVGAEARTRGGWREIGSAPKDGTTWFLGFGIPDWATDEPPRIMTCCWSVEANNWCDTGDFVELTHWMPLPSAPTERP